MHLCMHGRMGVRGGCSIMPAVQRNGQGRRGTAASCQQYRGRGRGRGGLQHHASITEGGAGGEGCCGIMPAVQRGSQHDAEGAPCQFMPIMPVVQSDGQRVSGAVSSTE